MSKVPPNRTPQPGKPGKPGKPGPPKPTPQLGRPGRREVFTGTMTVTIHLRDTTITIEGPVLTVLEILRSIFGTSEPQAVIARLMVKWGPEVQMSTKHDT